MEQLPLEILSCIFSFLQSRVGRARDIKSVARVSKRFNRAVSVPRFWRGFNIKITEGTDVEDILRSQRLHAVGGIKLSRDVSSEKAQHFFLQLKALNVNIERLDLFEKRSYPKSVGGEDSFLNNNNVLHAILHTQEVKLPQSAQYFSSETRKLFRKMKRSKTLRLKKIDASTRPLGKTDMGLIVGSLSRIETLVLVDVLGSTESRVQLLKGIANSKTLALKNLDLTRMFWSVGRVRVTSAAVSEEAETLATAVFRLEEVNLSQTYLPILFGQFLECLLKKIKENPSDCKLRSLNLIECDFSRVKYVTLIQLLVNIKEVILECYPPTWTKNWSQDIVCLINRKCSRKSGVMCMELNH